MGNSAGMLSQGEQVEMELRPHAKRLILPILAFLVAGAVLIAVIVLAAKAGSVDKYLDIVAAVAAFAVVVRYTIVPWVRWLSTRYIITNQRLIVRHGIIAQKGRDVPLSRIDDVDFDIDVLDRLFGCGTLLVESGSADGREVLDDIPDVEGVRLRLNELRQAAVGGLMGGPYRNNQYQGNPYMGGPTQSAPYPGGQYQGGPYRDDRRQGGRYPGDRSSGGAPGV